MSAHAAAGAVWSSGFRPFFLLGAFYGPVLSLGWLAAELRVWPAAAGDVPLFLVHGHELLLGFAVAIVCGVLLTALPSWSGTRELAAPWLVLLVALWLLGRAAFLLRGALPGQAALIGDCTLLPVLVLLLLPGLLRARPRLFLWTLPPLVALAVANAAFGLARLRAAPLDMQRALLLALYGLMFLYALYGGLLTPAFTRNFLRSRGEPAAAILVPLEYATALAMLALAAADLLGAPRPWLLLTAGAAVVLHGWRWARWRGWRTLSEPLLWTLHAGYAWFIVALALRGLAAMTPLVAPAAWVHAFTLGALGVTMGSLMTRVTLRHTGRPPRVSAWTRLALGALLLAPLPRLLHALVSPSAALLVAATGLWAAGLLLWLAVHARMLLTPSRPGSAASAWGPRPNFRSR
jgi:uncharacterized protein involved in response to NO